MFYSSLLLIVGLFLLLGGAEFLVRAATIIADKLDIPHLLIGLTVIAFGTSAPELFVSTGAALKGNADFSIGNVIGSNIFNILVIISISALLSVVHIKKQILYRDMPIMIFALGVFYFVSLNSYISRIEGAALCLGILAYLLIIYLDAKKKRTDCIDEVDEIEETLKETHWPLPLCAIIIVLSLIALVYGSSLIVDHASFIAKGLGISDFVISVTLVAVGTSLPELATTLSAARKGHADLAVGNAIGSNIFNVFSVIGVTALISPLTVEPSFLTFDYTFMFLACAAVWPLMLLRKQFSKFEGCIMLIAYFVYIVVLINSGSIS